MSKTLQTTLPLVSKQENRANIMTLELENDLTRSEENQLLGHVK